MEICSVSASSQSPKPRVLYVDAFSAKNAQANVWGMTKAYKQFAEVKLFDYRFLGQGRGNETMNRLLVELASTFKPDFIHLGKCETLKGTTIQKIRRALPAVKIIHIYMDYRVAAQDWVVDLGQHVDWTVMSCQAGPMVDMYRAAGCKPAWLSAGTDPTIFVPNESIVPDYDGVFMGNFGASPGFWWMPGRIRFIKALGAMGFQIHVFGVNTSAFKSTPNIHTHPYVGEAEFALSCARARIGLAYSPNRERRYTSWPRVVNTMACGTFLLTLYFPGIEELFEDKKHLVWFHTVEEAVNLFEHYLIETEERNKIAAAGRARVLERHTWDQRIKDLWEGVNSGWKM